MARRLVTGRALEVVPGSPYEPAAQAFIQALDEYVATLYPPESNHLLSAEALAAANCRFFVARADGQAVGCGAILLCGDYAEIKRMYVVPEARGGGVGRRVLERLEREAQEAGLYVLRLETGVSQHAAIALYRRAGFVERAPFAGYAPDPLSLFMEKTLA